MVQNKAGVANLEKYHQNVFRLRRAKIAPNHNCGTFQNKLEQQKCSVDEQFCCETRGFIGKGVHCTGIVMNPTDRSELALELSGTVGKRFLCALKSLIFVIL